ncbi:uncharacterized protein TNCV_1154101 [Trichonephila clavipes]|nr:uncharacterized protein TNCV_1154101 [Trichonephila clavipes]
MFQKLTEDILAMRCIGQGLESLKTFCAVMSLPNPVEQKSLDVINNKLSRVMKEVAEESMKMAAVEEYSSSPYNLLTVSCDGTCNTRGYSSLIGVCTVIGAETGRLTDSLIDKLAHYYGNAIRCNSTSVKEMRKAIWAVWGHSCSTDDEPIHWFCPTNPNTWCKYNAAINNLQNYKHKPSVAKAVQDVIKPVFADLSHPALLKKCLGGLDLAGSLILKNGEKNWVLILTCAVYRTIHLELLTSVSTESFLLGLRRFIARRGRPSVIYSDTGTNFKGAYRIYQKMYLEKLKNVEEPNSIS